MKAIEEIKAALKEATDIEVLDNKYREEGDLVDLINKKIKEDEEYEDDPNYHPYWKLLMDEEKERCRQIGVRALEAVEAATTEAIKETISRCSETDATELLENKDIYLWYNYDGYEDSPFFSTFGDMLNDELKGRGIYYDFSVEEFYECDDE